MIQKTPLAGCFLMVYSGGMDTLAKLFGGHQRVKIMRLFLLNQSQVFELGDVVFRSRVTRGSARHELNNLTTTGFIKQKTVMKEGSRGAKKRVTVWFINTAFQYIDSVRDLLVDPKLILQDDLLKRFKSAGKIKFMLVSGVFIGDHKNSRIDILMVGDKLKKNNITHVIKGLEAEIGKELNYVVFDSQEFKYRLDMYDKLVCDIIDYPHHKLVDTGQLSTYVSKK